MEQQYTVIGIYVDNNQPWIEWVTAKNPTSAAIKSIDKLHRETNLRVVEVIKGRRKGFLCNDEIMSREELKRRK